MGVCLLLATGILDLLAAAAEEPPNRAAASADCCSAGLLLDEGVAGLPNRDFTAGVSTFTAPVLRV